MKPILCNYYLTFRSNDMPEYSSLWRDPELQALPEAGIDSIKTNFLDLARIGIKELVIEGGEPLLREDLPEILALAKESKFKVHLTTNAILFEEKVKVIAPYLHHILFLLDYALQEEHDRSRGTACFKQIVSAIDLAKKAGIQPIIRYCLTLDSIRFLPELVDFAESRDVKVWIDPVYDPKYALGAFEGVSLEHIKYYRRHPLIGFSFAALEFIRARGNQTLWPRCKAVSNVITIFPDNSLAFPCFYLPQKRFKLDGDLFEVYTRPGFLKEIEKGQGKFPECQGCMAFSYMLPSFAVGFDRYFLLQWYSDWFNGRKRNQYNDKIQKPKSK